MKLTAFIVSLTLAGYVVAQNQRTDSTSMKMAKDAAEHVTTALKAHKSVTISVDNRITDYAPRIVNGRLLVPARLFRETGQRVLWTGADKRGIIRDDRDPRRTVEMDAREPKDSRPTLAMRPYLENGRLWVPLVQTVTSLGHTLKWVETSNRLNITSNRSSGGIRKQ